jgi:hypothetical protein
MSSKFAEIAPRIWAGVATDEELAGIGAENVYAIKSDGEHVHYRFTAGQKAVNKDKREVDYVASDETRDRSGDVVLVKGWALEAFAKNPLFLMEHMPSFGPLGIVPEIRKGTNDGVRALLAKTRVHEEDKMSDAARIRARLVMDGDVTGMSVGFIPIDPYRPTDDGERKSLGLGPYGVLHRKQELFELSSVLVPDNANAVQRKLCAMVKSGECSESLSREVLREFIPSTRVLVPVAKVFDDLAAEAETPTDAPASEPEVDPIHALTAQLADLKSTFSAELAALKAVLETRVAPSPSSPVETKPEAKSTDGSRADNSQAFYGAALSVPFIRYRKGRKQ